MENIAEPNPKVQLKKQIINIIDDTHECLRVRVPEYAGWTETKQNINSLYNDYIS